METHNIEYKLSWRDEYLKWICGFANGQGGKLFIGVNDNGEIAGLHDTARLLEDIPNKVKDILGIMVEVNKHTRQGQEYLEVTVDPYPYPISYKGQYHYRSGSTKQELKGAALDKFLLKKQGKRWDGIPVPKVAISELSDRAFLDFRNNAVKSKRLPKEILMDNNGTLLEKLKLMEGVYLKRAALLLFHPDPEKFVTGAYIKVGFFKTDDDLLYHDTIHGYLFEQVDKTLDLLLNKYIKAAISYEGVNRIETYPFPEDALREALLNAVAHKDYSSGNPIQISVYNDKIYLWNEGQLPENWTVKKLFRKHPSMPYNPDIANTLFRAGYIESWGRGILKIVKECKKAGLPEPGFKYDFQGFMIEFKSNKLKVSGKTLGKASEKASEKMSEKTSEKILKIVRTNPLITISGLASTLGLSGRSIERNVDKLQKRGLLKRIGPDKGGHWEVVD